MQRLALLIAEHLQYKSAFLEINATIIGDG